MSIALLAPLGLTALAALVLPLLIHLVRRLELTTTEFAALRWIAERTRPQRRLRFERPWLLLLRLALIALFALLLARPVVDAAAPSLRSWIVVAPGVALADARTAAEGADGEWHWLAPGFPRREEAPAPAGGAFASLLRELDTELPAATTLTVVVPEDLAGLDGERLVLSRKVDWRVAPGRMPDPAAGPVPAPIVLAVRYAPDSAPALRYVRAAVAAWNLREPGRYELDAQPVDAPIAESASWLLWLAPPAPALDRWLDRGGSALAVRAAETGGAVLWTDAAGRVLARLVPRQRGRLVALAGDFAPVDLPILLDADFPDRLRAVFEAAPAAPTRAPASAMVPRVADALVSRAEAMRSARPLDPWLALLVAVLFLLERIVATHRREHIAGGDAGDAGTSA